VDSLIDDLEEQCHLKRYRPPRFYPHYGLTSGRSNRKRPYVIRRRWIGTYLVQLERFEGRSSVIVYDESAGYDKEIAGARGLEKLEAEATFDEACDVVKEYRR